LHLELVLSIRWIPSKIHQRRRDWGGKRRENWGKPWGTTRGGRRGSKWRRNVGFEKSSQWPEGY